jgi:NADH-quinone oxidoreductase subunit J
MVITARNPVHSVLFLILCFFNAAGLFILMGAEFLAMILVVVYVGAVAVLFLFVVMMLDVDFVKLREGMANYLPVGGIIGLIVLVGIWPCSSAPGPSRPRRCHQISGGSGPRGGLTNTEALGEILYTKYIYWFQASGLVLLVAMVGAIVLTLRHKEGVKRQSIAAQVARTPATAVEIRKVEPGQGL